MDRATRVAVRRFEKAARLVYVSAPYNEQPSPQQATKICRLLADLNQAWGAVMALSVPKED